MIQDVGWQRESGSLTGQLTASDLQYDLAAYEQASNQGPAAERADASADVAFLKQTLSYASAQPSSIIDDAA